MILFSASIIIKTNQLQCGDSSVTHYTYCPCQQICNDLTLDMFVLAKIEHFDRRNLACTVHKTEKSLMTYNVYTEKLACEKLILKITDFLIFSRRFPFYVLVWSKILV